jgi:DNA-directed RNA polymerase subunit RPC12/RpoP
MKFLWLSVLALLGIPAVFMATTDVMTLRPVQQMILGLSAIMGGVGFLGTRWVKAELKRVSVPPPPPPPPRPLEETFLRILNVKSEYRSGHGHSPYYVLKCLTCGGNLERWADDARRKGVSCNRCGTGATIDEIQAWMRHELQKAPEEACIYCFMGPEKHVGDKCLFDSATYTPRKGAP